MSKTPHTGLLSSNKKKKNENENRPVDLGATITLT